MIYAGLSILRVGWSSALLIQVVNGQCIPNGPSGVEKGD